MSNWYYPPEEPKKEAEYLVEMQLDDLLGKRKVFNVMFYFTGPKNFGWQFTDAKIIRWMEIPK